MTLFKTVFLAVALELAIIWVLRNRTRLIKKVRLERLMYVGGIVTALSAALAWMMATDLAPRFGGLVFAAALLLPLVVAAEAFCYRYLARLLWRQAWIFSLAANGASWLAWMLFDALSRR